MEIKGEKIDTTQYEIGVIVARFQIHKLHKGHIDLMETVCNNHKKVIIFLGVSDAGNTKLNPLDFATRKAMVEEYLPVGTSHQIIVLPQKDQRSDIVWSKNLDAQIELPFGETTALLYGSRDSFIPHYHGKHKVVELIPRYPHSGSEIREEISTKPLSSDDFRSGIIYATYTKYPITYPTVDIVAYNENNQILLAKKPNEEKYRFIGGFVDRNDISYEHAARREFMEESNNCEINELQYVASIKVNDWRYSKTESGIMTILFAGKFMYGKIKATDDIASLEWINPNDITIDDIMPEHQELFEKLLIYFHNNEIMKINKFAGETPFEEEGLIETHITHNTNKK